MYDFNDGYPEATAGPLSTNRFAVTWQNLPSRQDYQLKRTVWSRP